jgi:hypothetical protein
MKKTKLFWLFGNLNRHPFFADEDETGGGNASDAGDDHDDDAQDDGKQSAYERNLADIQAEFDRQIEASGDADDEESGDQDKKEDKKSQQQDLEIDDDEDADGDHDNEEQDQDGDEDSADHKDGQDDDDKKSAISAELVQRAIRLGFDQDELSGFKSDATLSRVLDAMESRASGNQSAQDGNTDSGKQDDDTFNLELGDDYTDDFKDKMQKMNEFYASKLKSVRDELSTARQELNRIQGMEYVREFDASIKSLGDDWQDVFGKGSGQKLDPKGSQYKNRVKLDEEMSIIALGRKQMGKPPLNKAELFQRALQSAFSDKIKSMETAKMQKALKDRSRRSASRPTHRQTKLMTADEELLAIQTEFDRQMAEDGSD